jgi:hypothetical protein
MIAALGCTAFIPAAERRQKVAHGASHGKAERRITQAAERRQRAASSMAQTPGIRAPLQLSR